MYTGVYQFSTEHLATTMYNNLFHDNALRCLVLFSIQGTYNVHYCQVQGTLQHITWQCTHVFNAGHLATHHMTVYPCVQCRAPGNTSHDSVPMCSMQGTWQHIKWQCTHVFNAGHLATHHTALYTCSVQGSWQHMTWHCTHVKCRISDSLVPKTKSNLEISLTSCNKCMLT